MLLSALLLTLALEIQFYALYPLLFALQRRLGCNWTLALIAALNLVSHTLFERRGITLFALYWLLWYLGAWIAQWQIAGKRVPAWRLVALAAALLAAFSYSLYVVHLPMFVLLVSWLLHPVKPDSIFVSIGFFAITLRCAYVFHLLVERPVLRLLRKISSRRARRMPPLPGAGMLPVDGRR